MTIILETLTPPPTKRASTCLDFRSALCSSDCRVLCHKRHERDVFETFICSRGTSFPRTGVFQLLFPACHAVEEGRGAWAVWCSKPLVSEASYSPVSGTYGWCLSSPDTALRRGDPGISEKFRYYACHLPHSAKRPAYEKSVRE